MLDHGCKPEEIIKIKGLASIGLEEIKKAIYEVIIKNEGIVKDYKAGKKEALNFTVGQVMKHTRGRAEPKEAYRLVIEKIGSKN
jgi:aspartyl-tRNA(Asn)/glutamyl-tRNA(Gln) amidotransferase subunit B